MDYGRRYYPDRTVVSGHTPTFMIDGGIEGRVYQENGHLAIDCGAAYGNGIGILTLGSDEIAYVGGSWESNAVVKNC